MAVTLQNLRDIVYAIIRTDEDTSAYPLVLVDSFINQAQKKIFRGKVINPLTKETVWKWQLSFVNKEIVYSNVLATYATGAITQWDTTIDADTTWYPTTGNLYFAGIVVPYTGKSSTQFTGVSWILWNYTEGQQIALCYALPDDYSSSISVTVNNLYKLPNKVYDDIFEDLNAVKGVDNIYTRVSSNDSYNPFTPPFYTIKDNQYLIVFNIWDQGNLRFRYMKSPTSMTLATDPVWIPDDDYAKSTIPYLAVAELFYNRGEEWRAAEIINFAMGNIKEMYDYYNKSSSESMSWMQYGLPKSRMNF